MSQSSCVPEHPFLSHLVALLSIYDLEPNPKASAGSPAIPLPRYEGPRDLQTDTIERSLAKVAHRMRLAEEKLGAVHPWTPRREFENDTGPDDEYSPGLLNAAAFESGMSAEEELRLLKAQVQDVARVCKAVADGDLTQKITVPVQGRVMVQLKVVINTMVDKLGQFAKGVTRVSLEVGTEGHVVRPHVNWVVR
jgi:methyl-accepting chemotaxis protein